MTQGYREPVPVGKRLWRKVSFSGECWHWLGSVSAGYGYIGVGSRTEGTRKTLRVHRVVYELAHGPIPDTHEIHHTCGNKLCVRPSHLVLTTRKEHIREHDGPSGINARKTHCANCGEPLVFLSGGRRCKTCRNAWSRKKYRAALAPVSAERKKRREDVGAK